MLAARPAAAVPFWQDVSVVAAAVEVSTAPLAQVDTLLLWKRAGAQAASTSAPPCHMEPKSCWCQDWAPAGPLGEGFGVPAAKRQGSWPWQGSWPRLGPGLEA